METGEWSTGAIGKMVTGNWENDRCGKSQMATGNREYDRRGANQMVTVECEYGCKRNSEMATGEGEMTDAGERHRVNGENWQGN